MLSTIEVTTIFGQIEAFENDLITSQLVEFGAHTRPELALLLSLVDPGDTIFDIGGHIGTFGIPLAQRAGPKGRVLIVEGVTGTFEVLSRNVNRRCKGLRVDILNALILPAGLKGVWVMNEENTGACYIKESRSADPSPLCTSLDRLATNYFVPRILKIDIEGFEWHVLAESETVLAGRPIVYAEVNDEAVRRAGGSIRDLNRLFLTRGYRFFRNVGVRNGAHDQYKVAELTDLGRGGLFFDVLAIHRDDERLARLTESARAPVA